MESVSIAVGIPTWGRGDRVVETLSRIRRCDPQPAEVLLYVDTGDLSLINKVRCSFPEVRILHGERKIGPGGGRNECILATTQPIFVSFDDDSYPVDIDFFAQIERLFAAHPDAGVIGATIWHRNQPEQKRGGIFSRKAEFIGCGHALRVSAYRQTRGYLPRPIAYAMEETDLAIQLFACGWKIFQSGELRVFHDTELGHHDRAEITANSIANVALFTFLHYPSRGWPRAMLQVLNKAFDCLRRKRRSGVLAGLLSAPGVCWRFRRYRAPLPWSIVQEFLQLRTAK